MPARIRKILVANRGEIARRVLRTVRAMGLASVAVYSDADERAPHVAEADEAVRIGPAPSRESYLAIDRILDAARADRRRRDPSGLRLPVRERRFRRARRRGGTRLHRSAGRGDPPHGQQDRREGDHDRGGSAGRARAPRSPSCRSRRASTAARAIGYPVLIKASAGGGGKGMRIVRDEAAFTEAIADGAPRGRERVRRRDAAARALLRCAAPHRDPDLRRCARQRHPSRRARVLDPAPLSKDHRGGAVAGRRRRDAGAHGRGGGRGRARDRLRRRRHRRVHRRPGRDVLLPRGQHAPPGRASRDRGGDRARSGAVADPARPGRAAAVDAGGGRVSTGHAIEARLYAEDPRDGLPARNRERRRSGSPRCSRAFATTPASRPAPRSASTTIRCWPRSSRTRRHAPRRSSGSAPRARDARRRADRHQPRVPPRRARHPASRRASSTPISSSSICRSSGAAPAADPARDRIHAIVAALWEHEGRRAADGPLPASVPSGWRNNRWRAAGRGLRRRRRAHRGALRRGARRPLHREDGEARQRLSPARVRRRRLRGRDRRRPPALPIDRGAKASRRPRTARHRHGHAGAALPARRSARTWRAAAWRR